MHALRSLRLTITVPAGGSVQVTFSITCTTGGGSGTPAIELSERFVTFEAIAGGGNPPPATVSVTNVGGGTLTDLAAIVSYLAGQPTGWLSATLSGTTAPATLTLQATTGSLAPGASHATVNVASSVAANSPQSIEVSLSVSAPASTPVISNFVAPDTISNTPGDSSAVVFDFADAEGDVAFAVFTLVDDPNGGH
jgi:hypothetical protein